MRNNHDKPKPETILVVDDEQDNRMTLRFMLEHKQFMVYEAKNGEEALKLAGSIQPDLILLDVRMPLMDGFEACEQLKAEADTREIPVIFITSASESTSKLKGFELGGVDYVTKPFDPAELLARVRTHLDLRKAYQTIQRQQEEMAQELEQARVAQSVLMQRSPLDSGALDIVYKFVPMSAIGGDFYYVQPLDKDRVGFLVADVTGHGVAAALVTFMVMGLFGHLVNHQAPPQSLIEQLNSTLVQSLKEYKYVTAFFGIYNTKTGLFNYVNAGHPPACVVRQGESPDQGKVIALKSTGPILGAFENAKFEEKSLQLHHGDKVVIYTDPLIEVSNEQNQHFSYRGVMQYLADHCHLPIKPLIENLYREGLDYGDIEHYHDDATMVGFEVKPPLDF